MKVHVSRGFKGSGSSFFNSSEIGLQNPNLSGKIYLCSTVADSTPAQIEQQMKLQGSKFGYSTVSTRRFYSRTSAPHHANPKPACRQVKEAPQAAYEEFREHFLHMRSQPLYLL